MRQFLKLTIARLAAVLAVLLLTTMLAVAQGEVRKSPFGAGAAPVAKSEPAASAGSGTIWGWMLATQQRYQREMATAVRNLKAESPMAAAASLAFISFMYGVLHAAGPGHGKAVISSYVLANRQTMRRGIALSFLSAFFQACSAILLVGILALAFKATSTQMRAAESWIEIVSWAMVALVGVWLLYRQVKPMLGGWARPVQTADGAERGGHALAHDHTPAPGSVSRHSPRVAFPSPGPSVELRHGTAGHVHGPGCSHGHDHAHVHNASCGHAHMPEPSQFEGPWQWSRAIWLAMTVGIRPCTGAILVMIFALSQGLLWAGVFATFMMAFGTALTVSVLAALAVGSRDLAVRLTGLESAWAHRVQAGVGIGGAVLVIMLGTAGFLASLRGPAPF